MTDKKRIPWVSFPNGSQLSIVVGQSSGKRFFYIRPSEHDAEELGARAAAEGFEQDRGGNWVKALEGQFSVRQMAAALGGDVISVDADAFKRPPYMLRRRPETPTASDEAMEEIGRNALGELVLRDPVGRHFRRVRGSSGPELVSEGSDPDLPPALFLRASERADLPEIARGVVQMALHATVTGADFERVAHAASEAGPHGRGIGLTGEQVAVELRREVTALVVAERPAGMAKTDAHEQFRAAVKLSSRLGGVIDAGIGEAGYAPTPAVALALRRVVFGVSNRRPDGLEVAGSPNLMSAFDVRDAADPSASAVQVMDLTDSRPEAFVERIMQRLARRDPEGRSFFLLQARARDRAAVDLRHEIGTRYALETVADLAPIVVGGRPDASRIMVLGVGAKRPEPLAVLPQAARRTTSVERDAELWGWTNEVLRAHRRVEEDLRAGHEGEEAEAKDEREENRNQVPYRPLSQARPPFTMIPVGLEGATSKALERISRRLDDGETVDSFVASRLGFDVEQVGQVFTAEQVDAVAMALTAKERERAFMLVDATGIGKGRIQAAIARACLREGKRVIYLTESGGINVPDVWRDMVAVGADREAVPVVIANGAKILGPDGKVAYETLRPIDRKAFYRSEEQEFIRPDGETANLVLGTYFNLNLGEETDACKWLLRSVNEDTVVILDEGHNALSPKSNIGKIIRKAIENSAWHMFGTATWQRTPEGTDLYRAALPEGAPRQAIETALRLDGIIAQEAFATMLAHDGVLLRRDHDLANIDFEVRLPTDRQADRYREQLDALSGVVSGMLEATMLVRRRVDDAFGRAVRANRRRGADAPQAHRQAELRNQYSMNFGSPLLLLTKVYLNGMKVDQVVENAIAELSEGRKPLITFYSTSEALLKELMKDDTSDRPTEDVLAEFTGLSMKDQVARIHDRLYRAKVNNERIDMRERDPDVARHAAALADLIENLPDIPVSPVDAVIEGLEAAGFSIGELSGRTFCYREGQIQKRTDKDRANTVRGFNGGALDALIYNGAGATGGSFHASPDFADQRPRTTVEMETHPDIIKDVQGKGRGNRFGQVAKPRVVSVVTGLTPEMRLLAFRNQKLRQMGASIDANRAHPLLVEDIPDLINPVGDQAAARVLHLDPTLGIRLGLEDIRVDDAVDVSIEYDTRDTSRDTTSLASKLLARALILSPDEQSDVYERLCNEFEALVEELDSRKANPLRPLTVDGEIEIVETTLFDGYEEDGTSDLDESAFTAPLYLHTGRHHYTEEAIGPEDLMAMIDRSLGEVGADGFQRYADELLQMRATILQPFVPAGMTLEEGLEAGTPRLVRRADELDKQVRLLEVLKPGTQLTYPTQDWERFTRHTVVRLVAAGPRQRSISSAYKIDLVAPGDARPRRVSLSTLTGSVFDEIRFHRGFSRGPNAAALAEFREQGAVARRMPVQVLTGNTLLALEVARRNNLGSMSLYRTSDGQWERGVVVHSNQINLAALPLRVAGKDAIALMAHEVGQDGQLNQKPGHAWVGELKSTPLEIKRVRKRSPHTEQVCETLVLRARKFNTSSLGFWRNEEADRNGLHRFVTGGDDIPERLERSRGYHERSVYLDGTQVAWMELSTLTRALAEANVEFKASGKFRERWQATRNLSFDGLAIDGAPRRRAEPAADAEPAPGHPMAMGGWEVVGEPVEQTGLGAAAAARAEGVMSDAADGHGPVEPDDEFDDAGTWETAL